MAEQTLHVARPLVEHFVSITSLLKADESGRAVDLGVDGLADNKVADVLLRLFLTKVEQLCQALEVNSSVVLGNDSDVVFNDTLAQVLPALVGLGIGSVGRSVEDVGLAQLGTVVLGDGGPAHEFGNGKEVEEGGIVRDLLVARVAVDSVEQI